MRRLTALFSVILLALVGNLISAPSAQAQSRLCFAEVPNCIEGRFAEYWQQNGGLPVFGFPISAATTQQVGGGGSFLVQTFERNRFELHPENARPYDVLLGRLGDDRLRQLGRPWEGEPKAPSTSQSGCGYFAQTQHLVCGPILAYWQQNGLNLDGRRGFTEAESLALFGLPLTEARVENGSDGRPYLTQWFERARFEVHPEIRPDAVLLGLLGRETAQGGTPPPAAPSPAPGGACAGIPAPQNAIAVPDCGRGGTVFEFAGRGFRGGEAVGVYITAPDQSVFGAPFQVEADSSGIAGGVVFETQPSFPTGLYAITFEGVESRNRAVAYFKIIPADNTPPSGSLPPIPASQNATATPDNGPVGTLFTFQGRGFDGGEAVGVYITAPDQSVFGAPFQVEADGSGVTTAVTFQTSQGFPTGIYAITFEGVKSKRRAVAYFRVNP